MCLQKGSGDMTVSEGIVLCAVLLLALYGCARFTMDSVKRLLRPHEPHVQLVVTLHKTQDLEQQVRYAKVLADECRIPLSTDTTALDEEGMRLVSVLLSENYQKEPLR